MAHSRPSHHRSRRRVPQGGPNRRIKKRRHSYGEKQRSKRHRKVKRGQNEAIQELVRHELLLWPHKGPGELRAIVLDHTELNTSRMLIEECGLEPRHVHVPNHDPATVAVMRKEMPHLAVHLGSWADKIAADVGGDSRPSYDVVFADFCSTPSKIAPDIEKLFELGLLAPRAVLAFTASGRETREHPDQVAWSSFHTLVSLVHQRAVAHGYTLSADEKVMYSTGSPMGHFRCLLTKVEAARAKVDAAKAAEAKVEAAARAKVDAAKAAEAKVEAAARAKVDAAARAAAKAPPHRRL